MNRFVKIIEAFVHKESKISTADVDGVMIESILVIRKIEPIDRVSMTLTFTMTFSV